MNGSVKSSEAAHLRFFICNDGSSAFVLNIILLNICIFSDLIPSNIVIHHCIFRLYEDCHVGHNKTCHTLEVSQTNIGCQKYFRVDLLTELPGQRLFFCHRQISGLTFRGCHECCIHHQLPSPTSSPLLPSFYFRSLHSPSTMVRIFYSISSSLILSFH